MAGEMTPEQEARANDYANAILAELRAASTSAQCAAISAKYAKAFERLQRAYSVRAIHIVNLAEVKKQELANAPKTISTKRARRCVEPRQDEHRSLFD